MEGNGLANLTKDEAVQEQGEFNTNDEIKKNNCDANPPIDGSPILKLSNTSYSIQKSLKKKKKTLCDLIL